MPNSTENGLHPSQPRSQERARWACTMCRIRKIKCDANLPACSQCVKKRSSCVYTHAKTRAPTSRRSVHDTSQRLGEVEGAISKLLSDSPSHLSSFPAQTNINYPNILVDLMRLNLLPVSRKWNLDLDNTKSYYSSSCEIFTISNMRCIDYIVGNHSFSSVSHDRLPRNYATSTSFRVDSAWALPTPELMFKCLNVFLSYVNKHFHLFRDEEITAIFHTYMDGQVSPQMSCFAAVNIVCATSLGMVLGCRNEQSEYYLRDSLKVLSTMFMEPPNTIGISSIILAVIYLMTTSRNSAAATMLGAASQMILMAGYHRPNTSSAEPKLSEAEQVHQNRLFWRTYILDQELSLRLSKPPLFSEELVGRLPEVTPYDEYGGVELHNGSTLNYFREQVVLATLQNQVYRKLRSARPSSQSGTDFLTEYYNLQDKIDQWKSSLNSSLYARSNSTEADSEQSEGIALLQLGYYQTLIAIHSAVFLHLPLFNSSAIRDQVPAAIDHCAKAGRSLISIFNHYYKPHPLALYFVNHVPWNIDGLFLYMMQNKRQTQTRNDLQSLKALLDYIQACVPRCNEDSGFVSIDITHGVAMEVIPVS